jgi:hypothetical protein
LPQLRPMVKAGPQVRTWCALTRAHMQEAWLNFEAGALAKPLDAAKVRLAMPPFRGHGLCGFLKVRDLA